MSDVPAIPALTAVRPPTARAELGALVRLATPLVGANLLQMAVSAVDVMFVARLSTVDLAAATLAVFLFNLTMYSMIGLTSAAAPLIAAELGRRRHAVRDVRRSVRMALWAAMLGSVPVTVLLWNGEALFTLLGQDAEVARRAGGFLRITALAVLPGVMMGVFRISAAALGRPGWAFAVTTLALGLAIVGNWALVFGHLGCPALGLNGSALATAISLTLCAATYAVILIGDPRLRRYRLFGRWWRAEWSRLREIVRLGLPIMATWMAEGALFGGAAILMGLIGVDAVAAHAVALNIAAVAFQIPFGVAQAATIRVGLGYGARDAAWIARSGRVALAVGIGVMALTAIPMWLTPRLLVGVYLDIGDPRSANVVHLAVGYLAIAAMFQLVDGAQAVAGGVLRGVQDTRVPMLIALFGYWIVGFGTAILFGFHMRLAGQGVWIGLLLGLVVVAALLLHRWHRRAALGLVPAPASSGT